MASDRLVSFATAQTSTSAINVAGIRAATRGARPVAGRPGFFFGVTFIDFLHDFGLDPLKSRTASGWLQGELQPPK
jgi:hypothetical protein